MSEAKSLTGKLGAVGRRLHVQRVSLVIEAVENPVTALEMPGQSLAGAVDEDGGVGAVTGGECCDCDFVSVLARSLVFLGDRSTLMECTR